MHKLSIIFVLVCSIFPVLTHAVKVCGIDVQIPNRIAKNRSLVRIAEHLPISLCMAAQF